MRASTAARLQPRLVAGSSGDAFEQEADRMADRVLGMASSASPPQPQGREAGVQRTTAVPTGASALPAEVDDVMRSPGHPLDPDTRAFMEHRFGRDFSEVRVHTDAAAARSARSVQALAYTVGKHIAFSTGAFSPATHEGRRLLAHELTHVTQQTDAHRGAGNQTTALWLQRQQLPVKTIEQMDSELNAAKSEGRWRDVAAILNDMSDSDLTARVAADRLPKPDRDRLRAAIPEWAHRVRGAVLSVDYKEALAARDYKAAAVTVNGFDDAGIRSRLALLDASAVVDFYNAAVEAMSGVSLRRVLDALRDRYQHVSTDPLGTKTMTIVAMMQAAGVDAAAALAFVRLQLGLVPDSTGEKKAQTTEDVAVDVGHLLAGTGVIPPQLEAGNLAHSLIGGVYVTLNPLSFYDLPIAAYAARLANLFKAPGSTKDLLMNLNMRPDIVDLKRLQIYEIKPFTSQALAVAEMRDYITLLDGILKQSVFRPGSPHNRGTTMALPFTDQGKSGVLIWGCPVPGAILYRFLPKSEEPKAEQERAKLHEPGSQYEASVTAAAAVAVPLVIVGAEAMAALGAYEGLMGMLGAAVRFAGQALPRITAAGGAGAAAAKAR
ncbi:DUF4157 domain-containing protein [Streptomyces sp. NPDC049837]|uniref:eCIS core domain-containing protein n=1 Tax=Streptomyces sp. NPDC049837 TaxID=3155277 RepID=UPI0034427529